jgi:hypothetical protein
MKPKSRKKAVPKQMQQQWMARPICQCNDNTSAKNCSKNCNKNIHIQI